MFRWEGGSGTSSADLATEPDSAGSALRASICPVSRSASLGCSPQLRACPLLPGRRHHEGSGCGGRNGHKQCNTQRLKPVFNAAVTPKSEDSKCADRRKSETGPKLEGRVDETACQALLVFDHPIGGHDGQRPIGKRKSKAKHQHGREHGRIGPVQAEA